MGQGIAQVAAQAGYEVRLLDASKALAEKGLASIAKQLGKQVEKGKLEADVAKAITGRITPTDDYASLADVVIAVEAATENPDVKLKILAAAEAAIPEGAILASNTSSISITRLAGKCKHPARVIGMHFMNPVPLMKLVEVIRGRETSDEVTAATTELAKRLGKTPAVVHDSPGFVSNRVLMPMINEAIECLREGVSTKEDIDTIMKLGMAHPMGPIQLADYIGLDVCLAIMEVLDKGFGGVKYKPSPILREMVAAGKLGVKSGEGFYMYPKK